MITAPWRKSAGHGALSRPSAAPIIRWQDEFDEMMRRMFDDFAHGLRHMPAEAGWTPATDFEEDEQAFTLRAEIPGVDPKHVKIAVSGRLLTISGEKSTSVARKDKSLVYQERSYGAFQRSFELSEIADADRISFGGPVERHMGPVVRDAMRLHVATLGPNSPMADAIDIFRRIRVRHIPVVDQGKLVGVVSDRDVRRSLGWSNIRDMQSQERGRVEEVGPPPTVAGIMQPNLIVGSPEEPVRDALQRMLDHRIHSLPIAVNLQLLGILTISDFTKVIAQHEVI